MDKEPEIRGLASRLYPIIFRYTPTALVDTCWNYLLSEVNIIAKGGLEAAADPLIMSLTPSECDREYRIT